MRSVQCVHVHHVCEWWTGKTSFPFLSLPAVAAAASPSMAWWVLSIVLNVLLCLLHSKAIHCQSIHELTSYNTNSKSEETCEWDGEREKEHKKSDDFTKCSTHFRCEPKSKAIGVVQKKNNHRMRISEQNVWAHRSLCPSHSRDITISFTYFVHLSAVILFDNFCRFLRHGRMYVCMSTFIRSLSAYLLFFIHSANVVGIPAFCCCSSSFNHIL